MTAQEPRSELPHLAIIGGGFSGSLLALKLAALKPPIKVVLIEQATYAGRGLAYGADEDLHLLNVPVQRMESGLTPGFADWLRASGAELTEAETEAGGDLLNAFVARSLFGRYMQSVTHKAIRQSEIERIRAAVVRITKSVENGVANYRLHLDDGRLIEVGQLVLATGNLVPSPPKIASLSGRYLQDMAPFVPDPWAYGALDAVGTDAPVLLIGTGLTMVDVAIKLKARGHRGPIVALSRRGRVPQAHRSGGQWTLDIADTKTGSPQFLSPLSLIRILRAEARRAAAQSIPWQRVIDAVRPLVAQTWAGWKPRHRRQFMRHARPWWEIHRHRLAPRAAARLDNLIASGELNVIAGRLTDFERRGEYLSIGFQRRHTHKTERIEIRHVINCTGPHSNYAQVGMPLFTDLRAQGLIQPDALGLGIETADAHVIDAHGHVSNTLFAIGPLTRPAWWEVTAVPEITVQVSRLVQTLRSHETQSRDPAHDLSRDFFDLGAGI